MTYQPAFDGFDAYILILGVFLRQVQQDCNSCEVRDKLFTLVCSHPEDVLVLVPVAIGILHTSLRLANAAQTTNRLRLRQGRCLFCWQLLMQPLEHFLAACEKRVTPI